MSLRYCARCDTIWDDLVSAIWHEGVPYCVDCKLSLLYFGREDVVLSNPDELKAYDERAGEAKAVFTGKASTVSPSEKPVELLAAESMLLHDPGNEPALDLLSAYYRSKGDPGKATDYAKAWVDAAPENTKAYQRLAQTYMAQARFKDAVQVLHQIEAFAPTPELYYQLGVAYALAKEFDKALAALDTCESQASNPENVALIKSIRDQILAQP